MADLFISYAHANRRRVEPISTNLQQAGFSLWWDDRLRAGDDFTMTIERELDAAKGVVVAWSEAARNSLWVRAEATEALDENKLVQLRLDGVRPPLPFTVVQMIDLTRWRGGQSDPWPEVEAEARGLVGGGSRPALDARVFQGPALQDMGGMAMWGWLAIALAIFNAALTIQAASGNIGLEIYGVAATASFALACVALIATLWRVVRTALATGRMS